MQIVGVFLCAEMSVIQICSGDPEGPLESPPARPESLSQPQSKTLPQPVRLDPLSPEITPNSLCSLTGQSSSPALSPVVSVTRFF